MDGILLIQKEAGMTSHDVVARLRHILHMKKIGHSGTLDPNATGVLLILLGRACKVLPYLQDTDKEYIARLQLGIRTLSDDIWGDVLQRAPIKEIHDFQGILQGFLGEQQQIPPLVSSVRVQGHKLYEYARANKPVDRPMRTVNFYALEVLDEKRLLFRVACSSGTYIRSLCVDIAKKSGNLGCMQSLIRTKVGRFSLAQCVTLQDVAAGNFSLHPIREVLSQYPMCTYTPIENVYHGKKISLAVDAKRVVIIDGDEAIAIYDREHDTTFRCVRGLW